MCFEALTPFAGSGIETLPRTIETLEEEKARLMEALNSTEFYADRDMVRINEANERLGTLEKELDQAYCRWGELESLAGKLSGGMAPEQPGQ
jgi:hypothetical protein